MRRLLLMVLATALFLVGCAAPLTNRSAPAANPQSQPQPTASTQKQTEHVTLNLYFPDNKGEKLVMEKRELAQLGPASPQQVIDQLILGPITSNTAVSLIPKGTTAKVSLSGDMVTVDFSPEIRNVNVGSTGEALLLNSILACLFEIPAIQHVQILVDGKSVESLAGHVDISKPLSRRAK